MNPTSLLSDIRLKRGAALVMNDGEACVQHLGQEILLDHAGSRVLRKLSPYLDKGHDSATLAAYTGETVAAVEALARALEHTGVMTLHDTRAAPADGGMSGLEFHAYHRRYAQHWLQPVYAHPFWAKVVEGRATRAQVLGFAFEKYHYIEAAHEHMGVAAANARPELMPHLARHFIEEYRHGDIYRRGLQSLFDDAAILAAPPLPTTRALVNFLSETAAVDSFGYYAANEVLQMTENSDGGDDDGAVDAFYAGMRRHYPESAKLIEAFVIHTKLDQNLGHDGVFEQMCRDMPRLAAAEVASVMNRARGVVERLLAFMDGIDRWYEAFPQVPRRPYALGAG